MRATSPRHCREIGICTRRRTRFEYSSAGTAALARRGIAVWDRVPRAGVVRNDVASLSAPSRPDGSATARNAVSSSDMRKSSTFGRRRSPRGRFERHLVVGSRQAHLRAAACALRRPSGTNSAVPPRCLAGRSKSVARAARAGMGVSMRKFNGEVVQDDSTDLCAKKVSTEGLRR